MLFLLLALPLTVATASLARDSAISAPEERHLVLLGAARDLVERVGDRVWPGWGSEGFELLLVDGEREFLIGRQSVPAGFEPLGLEPPGLGPATGGLKAGVASRDRVFPAAMLATMAPFGLPAVPEV